LTEPRERLSLRIAMSEIPKGRNLMPEKFTTSQKTRRTMMGVKPNEGRIGKRSIKDHHITQKQKKGDRRMNPPKGH
jgi:hypothetical protein